MKNRLIKIVLFILFISSTNNLFSQNQIDSLKKKIENYIESKNIPGISISIVKSDSIIFSGGIGYANIEKKERVTDKHLFRLGSISKSFTALGLYNLIKESRYSLSSPIREIDKNIPFTNKWEQTDPVLVSHLLEHTTGFDEFHAHAIYNKIDSVMPPVINMVNDHNQSLHSRWQPGTKKAYSNPNYIVAGHLIEILSGVSSSEYIKENILNNIGMESSNYYFKKPKGKLFAQGYQRTGNTLNAIPFATINGSPAGEFCANAKDMTRYLQVMLKQDTTIFSKETFDRIEKPKTSIAAKKGLRFGYGLGNYTIWKNGHLFHGHGGQIDGFAARYIYSREADLGIAIAINRNGDANAIVDEILDLLLDIQNQAPLERKTFLIPKSLKTKFSGFYEFKSPRNELLAFSDRMFGGFILDFKEEMLVRRRLLGRPKDTLYYAGNNQFYFEKEGVPSAMLIESDYGKPAFWIHDNYTEKESRTKRLLLFFGLLISFLLVIIFFISSFIWLIRNFIKKKRKNPINHLVLFGVGLGLILIFVGFGLTMSDTKSAMNVNFSSLLLYFSSYALVLLSIISIYRWTKLPSKKGFKIFYKLTSIGAIFISIYLWNIGFIGLKLWSY
ncbi:serine hydrolase domain-containing protein [Aquimarina sp. 2201CG14-23]|uniref:serine hydrolase domain-containing protein n=1 Tax=Aquimarina mycalae TaxID=3040073 RepID=UPI002477E42E|nr:serine hydrolase domain-containing protein [Aquimarina sp. 2201CG14-23]MDH7445976.1 serine hydrolase domain-containing protein [Aquimarina sp. 2201CG14-23]